MASFGSSSVWCFFVSVLLCHVQVVEAMSVSGMWYFWFGMFFLVFLVAFAASGMWRRHRYMQRNRVACQTVVGHTTVVHTTQTSGAYPAPPGGTTAAATVPPYGYQQPQPYGFQHSQPQGQTFGYAQPQPPAYGFNPPPNPPNYNDPAYPPSAFSNPPPSYQSATNSAPFQPADPFVRAAKVN